MKKVKMFKHLSSHNFFSCGGRVICIHIKTYHSLNLTQVSCCATSDLLSDRLNYPYFLGLATPLNYTTRVMLQMVNKLGSNNIQVLFSDGKYGESAVKLILSLAPSFNICVAQTVRVYGGDNGINSVVTSLQRFPGARHVLVYIASPLMPKVARAINNMNEHRRFLFIGENCFYHKDYMLNYPNLRGSLIVAEQPIPQSDEYKRFLRHFDPACVKLPTSLLYFMQENLNCYYEFSFKKEFPQKCHPELLRKFPEHLDKWTPYLIKSTTALIKGAYQAIKSMCKDETICSEYRNSPERVVEFVRNVTLDTDGDDRDDQLFDSNANGVLGLKIYIIEEKDFVEARCLRNIIKIKEDQIISSDKIHIVKIVLQRGFPLKTFLDCFLVLAKRYLRYS